MKVLFSVLLFLVLTSVQVWCQDGCSNPLVRNDCGYFGINSTQCEDKGCCWSPTNTTDEGLSDVPWCFFKPELPPQYIISAIDKTALGVKLTLKTNATSSTRYGPPISPLIVEVSAQTQDRLHVKIYDPNNERWEIPEKVSSAPSDPNSLPSSMDYSYDHPSENDDFTLDIKRGSDTIFKMSNLIFYDQYLSLTTPLPSDHAIYGIGEHVTPYFRLKPRTYTLWTYDTPTPQYLNLYGSHPFYLDMRSPGAHGVYLRSSNGMDVILGQQSLTYNINGGIFDFYIFMGPQPEAVIEQYQQVIGRPHFPPYWALGFHQCRYGYPNIGYVEDVVNKFITNKIPLDTIWNDIDYMDQYKDFSLDPTNYPQKEVNAFVKRLHKEGRHYIHIIDPGIKVETGYFAYDNGLKEDLFIKDANGKVFTGKVWPGITAFPDFFHPKANEYWENNINYFHSQLAPVDGLWIDMNEVSNFCSGECSNFASAIPGDDRGRWEVIKQPAISPAIYKGFNPNAPPYNINNQGSEIPLNSKAISPDANHYNGILEYNVHNMFGLMEAMATKLAIENIRKSRSIVISRSTFPGSGVHTGHWTGDNHATWDDLYQSIPGLLNFQMFGIPLVGADICGFNGATTEELCGRWMQLGAFYPFSRNHNAIGTQPQEPYTWESVANISRTALSIRYSILPYYYTLFYKAHREPVEGKPSAVVMKPLFFEFPSDSNTYDIDRQFMIGSAILISPVLQQGANSVNAYFPSGIWYDYYTLSVVTDKGQKTESLIVNNDIPIHIRGGSIIPMHEPGLTTVQSRESPLSLLVALDNDNTANGDLYYDDGESLDYEKNFIFIDFKVASNELTSSVTGPGYSDTPLLDKVTIVGLTETPNSVTVNGKDVKSFTFTNNYLIIDNMNVDMTKMINIKWS